MTVSLFQMGIKELQGFGESNQTLTRFCGTPVPVGIFFLCSSSGGGIPGHHLVRFQAASRVCWFVPRHPPGSRPQWLVLGLLFRGPLPLLVGAPFGFYFLVDAD